MITDNSILISIVTPSYNCSDFIAQTIDSVKSQTYNNWEMIIVDDCSTDNSIDIINSYAKEDNRIKLYRLEKNSGAAVARTKAIELAKGDYIAFLDSDDIWLPEKLQLQLEFMVKNNYHFTSTKYSEMSHDGKDLRMLKVWEKTNYRQMLKSCRIGNSSVMYNCKALGKYKVPDIKRDNDFVLWLKIIKDTDYVYGLDKHLMKYRLTENSISRKKSKKIKYHWLVFRQYENLSFIYSLYLIFYWFFLKVFKVKYE